MSHRAFAVKYRPQRFSEIVGQEAIAETLKNAVKTSRVAHAYIFAGPRGVGKTSTARILAKALNCENVSHGEPCGSCSACRQISSGNYPDVIEIDAASNRGIDQIRELRENVYYAPVKGKWKVYIIDEFHMLTKEAFNALLKTLEEPPEHVVFILATTEIDKIPPTILSRCQRFLFRKIPQEKIIKALLDICKKEKISCDEESLKLIAAASEGCLRDAESLLDQAVALCGESLSAKKISEFLGILSKSELLSILRLSFEGDYRKLFDKLKKLELLGYSPSSVLRQLLFLLEELFFEDAEFNREQVLAAFEIMSKSLKTVDSHPFPFSALFFTLSKLSYFKDLVRIEQIIKGKKKIDLSRGFESRDDDDILSSLSPFAQRVEVVGKEIYVEPKSKIFVENIKRIFQNLKSEGYVLKLVLPEEKGKFNEKLPDDFAEKVNLVAKLFNAKLLPGYPRKVKDESSGS